VNYGKTWHICISVMSHWVVKLLLVGAISLCYKKTCKKERLYAFSSVFIGLTRPLESGLSYSLGTLTLTFLDFRAEWRCLLFRWACLWVPPARHLSLLPQGTVCPNCKFRIIMSWCLGVLICASHGGQCVLRPQGQISDWLPLSELPSRSHLECGLPPGA
jgi:hypothetical protein